MSPIDVPCAQCGAVPGQRCIDRDGATIRVGSHQARYDAAASAHFAANPEASTE